LLKLQLTLAALSRRGIFIQSPGTADRLKY
jgi:hypothetical protein